MTNTTNTITAMIEGHGLFRVTSDHLTATIARVGLAAVPHLCRLCDDALGLEGTYSDLNRAEALVVLSYLTGGCAD